LILNLTADLCNTIEIHLQKFIFDEISSASSRLANFS